jgi:hypothetical protein
MSYDALCRGRHSLHYQVYCITTVTRDRHPLFTDIHAARLLVHELRRVYTSMVTLPPLPGSFCLIICIG